MGPDPLISSGKTTIATYSRGIRPRRSPADGLWQPLGAQQPAGRRHLQAQHGEDQRPGSGKAPRVEFAKPLSVSETTIKVLREGNGERIKENQKAEVGYLAYNGQDGSQLADTYLSKHESLPVNDALKKGNEPLYKAILGVKQGSDLAIAMPGQGGTGPTQLLVLHVFSATDIAPVLSKPEGDAVTPPAGLPKVTVNDKQEATIDVKGVAAPKQLIAQDLIKGKGAEVKSTDTIVAKLHRSPPRRRQGLRLELQDRQAGHVPSDRRHPGLDQGPDRQDGRLPCAAGHPGGGRLRRQAGPGPSRG